MMITLVNDKGCCGCTACASACPQNCIEMHPDSEGFLYPVIDKKSCINCGNCQRVCPVLKVKKAEVEPECYIGFSKDRDVRKNSSSGGIFTELAKQVIDNGGVIYGAGFDSDFDVKHFSIYVKEDISLLRGSKYVQSSIGEVYREIKGLLKSEKLVYFSGTPCQVAGLYSYLDSKPHNLVTQDLICHGVGSPMVWRKYLEQYGRIKKVCFRNKKYGWHYFSMHIETDKKKVYQRLDEDFYLRLFLDNLILRPICYDCPIKKSGSQADITLADCWSPQKVTNAVIDYDEGLSLVIANTEKGKTWLEQLKSFGDTTLYAVDTHKAINSQSSLTQSVDCPEQRGDFFRSISKDSFMAVAEQWYSSSVMGMIRRNYIFIKTKIRFVLIGMGRKK